MIDQVFANLDRWRHVPAYPLERWANVFFGAHLRRWTTPAGQLGAP